MIQAYLRFSRDLIAAVLFGLIETLVRSVEELGEGFSALVCGNAASQSDFERTAGDGKISLFYYTANPFGKLNNMRHVLGRHKDQKLLSAESNGHIAFAAFLKNDGRNLRQDMVSGEVSVGIVDAFKMIQIEHDDTDAANVTPVMDFVNGFDRLFG